MPGTPDNLGAEEESVGMTPEEPESAKMMKEPVKIISPVSGKRKPTPTYEKVTLSITFGTAISLPFSVIGACLIPWQWGETNLGRFGIFLELLLGTMVLWSLISTVFADPYADPRWVPTNATEEELRAVREKAPKAEKESVDEKLARALVCTSFSTCLLLSFHVLFLCRITLTTSHTVQCVKLTSRQDVTTAVTVGAVPFATIIIVAGLARALAIQTTSSSFCS